MAMIRKTVWLRTLGVALMFAGNGLFVAACKDDDDKTVGEAVEELKDEAEDAAEEVEDEIDDRT
jgi:hypothetical protein